MFGNHKKKKYTDTYIYIYIYNTPCHTWIVRQNMLRDLFHIHFQYFRHLAPFSTSEEPCKEQCSPCKYPRAKETAKQLLELRCEGVLDFTEILFLYLLMGSFYLSCVCVCVCLFFYCMLLLCVNFLAVSFLVCVCVCVCVSWFSWHWFLSNAFFWWQPSREDLAMNVPLTTPKTNMEPN